MDARRLVAGDCGQSNALVQLANTVNVGASERLDTNYAVAPLVPATFDMRQLYATLPQQRVAPGVSVDEVSQRWAGDFAASSASSASSVASSDTVQALEYNHGYSAKVAPPDWLLPAHSHRTRPLRDAQRRFDAATELGQQSFWNYQFLSDVEAKLQDSSAPEAHSLHEQWAREFLDRTATDTSATPADGGRHVDEFLAEMRSSQNRLYVDDFDEFQRSFLEEWNNHDEVDRTEDVISERQWKYVLDEENPLRDVEDAFAKGLQCFEAGEIPNAVLYFEAALLADNKRADAWLYLGLAQQENEEDSKAIAAFRQCLLMQPHNAQALLNASASYANEWRNADALRSIFMWMKAHKDLDAFLPDEDIPHGLMFPTHSQYDKLIGALMKASNAGLPHLEVGLQTALGILFHMTGDYEKAVDCFRAAVTLDPTNARLWNRLGATLANGQHPEQAISAYSQALSLSPGFIRCRYNLGVACLNMKIFDRAVEHFIECLTLQKSSQIPDCKMRPTTSDSIWDSLRSTLVQMERFDMAGAVVERDLDRLTKELCAA